MLHDLVRPAPWLLALAGAALASGFAHAQAPPRARPAASGDRVDPTLPSADQIPLPDQAAPVAGLALPTIVTTATRGPRPIEDVPATVSVIDREQLDRQNAVAPRDVTRYEPGVSMGNQPTRAGATNYVIRGIGDNRVRVQIDGVRVPDFPASNVGAGTYTRDFVDLDTVKRIEIVRGPASALYGSDAMGGVVAYVTKDPSDYLTLEKPYYAALKFGYNGADSSLNETVTAAARSGPTEALLSYTRRDGHEVVAHGGVDTNPQVFQQNALLARVVNHITAVDTVRLTGEYVARRTTTDVRTDLGAAQGVNVLSSNGRDTNQRGRLTADYVRDAPIGFMDRLEVRLNWSGLNRREYTDQYRATYTGRIIPTTPNRIRFSDFRFQQDIYSGEAQATTRRSFLGADHTFTYGLIVEQVETRRPRNRSEVSLVNGSVLTTVAGETFPNKNFPDTGTTNVGAYVQDEIVAGRVRVVPAIRLDYYRLRPHPDADFARSYASGNAVLPRNMDEVAASPKLGAVYDLGSGLGLFGQYAHGFRAPPYDNANFGFVNRAFGYQILPNGDLKSETSNGVEIGLRGRFGRGGFAASTFYNRYDDFIDTVVVNSAGGLVTYQYQNISEVQIWGAEAKGDYEILPRVVLRGSVAWARGENVKTGAPLDSVDPVKLVGGIGWQSEGGLGLEAIVTHAWQHDRVSSSAYFKAPAYTLLDLTMQFAVNPNFMLNAGVYNVFNQKYFNSQDVIGVAAASATRDLYAQPGRYAAVNATIRW